MPLSQIVNNVGVGNVEATFLNLTTTVAAANATPFTEPMIDAYQRAASLLGSNYLGHGTTTFPLFGAVVGVSENNQATKAFPERLTAQVYGFAAIEGTTGPGGAIAAPLPGNHGWHPMQRQGCVAQETTTQDLSTGYKSRGQITEVYDTDRTVVLF